MRDTKFWKDADGDGHADEEDTSESGVAEEDTPESAADEEAVSASGAAKAGPLLPPPPLPPSVPRQDGLVRTMMLESDEHEALEVSIQNAIAQGEITVEGDGAEKAALVRPPPPPPSVKRQDGLVRTMMLESGEHDALEASIQNAIAEGELAVEGDAEDGDEEDEVDDSVDLMPSGSIDIGPTHSQRVEKPVYELICPACYHKPPMGTEAGVDGKCTECDNAYFVHTKSHEKFGDDPLLGRFIDQNYIVTGIIGQGGFGTVYRAVQKSVNREVAIKVIRLSGGDQANLSRRFEREARVIASFQHPNIVTLYDFGVLDDGTLYMVQELIHGHELADELVNKKPLAFARATRIVAAALDALVVAHDKGLVHRDLKPANIMLVQDRRGGELVKVLDFGIAKVTEGDDGPDEKLTQTGMVFGTPHYMAPEQSGTDPVDGRCDLYAMGIVLYQLLAGHLPFDSGSTFDILLAHRSQPVPVLPDDIPETLAKVVYKSLEKLPDNRFPDAFTMAAALRESIGDQSGGSGVHPTIRPMSGSTRVSALQSMGIQMSSAGMDPAQKPKRALMYAIVAILVIAIGAAAVFFMSKANEERRAKANAELRAHNAELQALSAKKNAEKRAEKAREDAETKAKAKAAELAAQQANKMVTVSITSTPSGADVYRKSDMLRMGQTPFTRTEKTREGENVYVIKKKGYQDLQVVLPADNDGAQQVILEAVVVKRTLRRRTPKKKKIADDGFVNPFE